ncbi:Branched-chain-amino-acid aminotransferase, cytosolic [Lamellibrachia satsuma]|nr:Branched-chain-amino-acid aminotransferase, cytosolic [Lamellibrachia satsuma]
MATSVQNNFTDYDSDQGSDCENSVKNGIEMDLSEEPMRNLKPFHQCGQLLSGLLKQRVQRCISTAASFKFDDLRMQLCSETEKRTKPDPGKLVFGHEFTDHMLEIEWTLANGWGPPTICPLHDISLHPAAKVLHYAVELFEGLKAYRGVDNKVRLFRPYQNIERMLRSAGRSALPLFDSEEFLKCLKRLISIEKEWVPHSTTSSLYVRPTMIGTEGSLGVSVPNRSLLYVIMGPVGAYFPTGMKPVSLMAEPKYTRAFEGGCGNYKIGSNYAPTINVQVEAMEKYGCQQVLWLYGPDHLLTEVGTMNIFMYWINPEGEKELLTHPLSGIILPGVTRGSLIELAKKKGEIKVTERPFGMGEVILGLKEGRVKEMFGSGTACVVCPVKEIVYQGERLQIPTMKEGAPVTMAFFKELTDIQYGRTPNDWMVAVD